MSKKYNFNQTVSALALTVALTPVFAFDSMGCH